MSDQEKQGIQKAAPETNDTVREVMDAAKGDNALKEQIINAATDMVKYIEEYKASSPDRAARCDDPEQRGRVVDSVANRVLGKFDFTPDQQAVVKILVGRMLDPKSAEGGLGIQVEDADAGHEAEAGRPDLGTERVAGVGSGVEAVRNDVKPKSDNPRDAFDASKIPRGATVHGVGGQMLSTDTKEGRNIIASENVREAIEAAERRANILENTGKLPEELAGADLTRANAQAASDLLGFEPAQELIDKYFVEEK